LSFKSRGLIHVENFDYNIAYEHSTAFVVGTLAEIRKRCNEMATRTPPAWRFVKAECACPARRAYLRELAVVGIVPGAAGRDRIRARP
jgi:hypothetical protein